MNIIVMMTEKEAYNALLTYLQNWETSFPRNPEIFRIELENEKTVDIAGLLSTAKALAAGDAS